MGRLGFNLVRQKDAEKNVESGTVAEQQNEKNEDGQALDQQNDKNENVEMGEILVAFELRLKERNRKVQCWRTTAYCLSFIVIVQFCILIKQDRSLRATSQIISSQFNVLKGNYEDENYSALRQLSSDMGENNERPNVHKYIRESKESLQNCTRKLEELSGIKSKLEKKLELEEALRKEENANVTKLLEEQDSKCAVVVQSFVRDSSATEAQLKEQLRKANDDLAELQEKLQAANKQLEEQRKITPAPTAAPATSKPKSSSSFFSSEQLKKFNNMVKDIESVGQLIGTAIQDVI